jgi:hypothetical protein
MVTPDSRCILHPKLLLSFNNQETNPSNPISISYFSSNYQRPRHGKCNARWCQCCVPTVSKKSIELFLLFIPFVGKKNVAQKIQSQLPCKACPYINTEYKSLAQRKVGRLCADIKEQYHSSQDKY